MNKDEYYMNIALKEARKAYLRGEVPVGCIIVQNDKIIARGYNMRESQCDIFKHAEIIAIQKASKKINNWRLSDMVMYVTLYPCPMCASAIVASRIKKIVIGAPTKDKKIKYVCDLIFEGNNTSPKIEVVEKKLEKESKKLLRDFFEVKRKKL